MGLEARRSKPGEDARRAAVQILTAVLKRKQSFDDVFDGAAAKLDGRDRAFAYALASTSLRRKGELDAIIGLFLDKRLPRSAGPAEIILLTAAAQLLFMEMPAHAAIDLAVTIANNDPDARHFSKLVNAVLRKVAGEGAAHLGKIDTQRVNTPDWLWRRWQTSYGEATARDIARAHLGEPPLDLSAKRDAAAWVERLDGVLLPTGTIRIEGRGGTIDDLAGYNEGAWWVQDAAARLPVLLFGDIAGKRLLDLCAAPGGKTAQLAAAGAGVTAVDKSSDRMERLRTNLERLKLTAFTAIADAERFTSEKAFDAVLLDAPCSATGTIRRHPDLPHIKDEAQIAGLAELQARMLSRAASLVVSGGTLVYSTCSLEPEEGEMQIARFLDGHREFARRPIAAGEVGGQSQFINPAGDLRTLPSMTIGPATGLDGFFAARLVRG